LGFAKGRNSHPELDLDGKIELKVNQDGKKMGYTVGKQIPSGNAVTIKLFDRP
jgi:hypothetical protein